MNIFLDPAILFFIFGLLAGFARSNLEIPPAISKFLSLYLLMALGLKGGFALYESGVNSEVALSLIAAIFLAILVPVMGYFILSKKLKPLDAAAIAATYGSISAITFITASQSLDQSSIHYGGHMTAAMALMESPAIIFAIITANRIRAKDTSTMPCHPPFPALALLPPSSLLSAALSGLYMTGAPGGSIPETKPPGAEPE
jgi:hypothetical protein